MLKNGIFEINDAHAVMTALARQATGQLDISVVDHTSFIDAGTTTLATGKENVLGAIAKTIAYITVTARPYKGKFSLINPSDREWNMRKGKISFYSKDPSVSGAFNVTDGTTATKNIGTGLNDDSGAGSMWEQNLPRVLENFFLSEAAWDRFYTTPLKQLQNAFNDERQFINFMNGYMIEVQNDIETETEARNRAIIADRIAGTYSVGPDSSKVNLTALTNEKLGTNYTSKQLLTSHRKELAEVMAAYIKIHSDRMTERTVNYHDPKTITETTGSSPSEVTTTYSILRHTPKEKQRLMLFSELLTEAKALVMPEIFNPEYLTVEQYEGVTYWQSPNDRMKISCKPALPDGATSTAVTIDNVVGILFDADAIETNRYFEGAYATPINARHMYYNTFYHYLFGAVNDYTENAIIFYLEDPAGTSKGG